MSNAWSLLVRLQGDVRQMEYALGSVERGLGGLEGRLARSGRSMSAAGRAMTIGISAPLIGLGGSALKMAADFEESFTSVKKTVDEADLRKAGLQFSDLEKDVRQLALQVPIAATDLAQVMAQGGALGIDPGNLAEYTEVVAKLDQTADDLDFNAAAKSLGHMNSVLNFGKGEMRDMADSIVHLGNRGAATEGEITSMATAFAGAAKIAGFSNREMIAWSAAMANVGEKAQAGGTTLSRMATNFTDFVNKGGSQLRFIAKTMDMTEEGVRKAFGQDSSQLIADFFQKLSKGPKTEWIDALEKLDLDDLLRRRGLTKMLNALRRDSSGSIIAMLKEVDKAGGAMEREFTKRMKALNPQLGIIVNHLKDAAITLGESLIPIIKRDFLPMLSEAIEGVKSFADWFAKLPEPVRKTALALTAVAVAMGPLMFLFGGFLQFLSGAVRLTKGLGGGLLGLARKIPGLGGLLGGGKGLGGGGIGGAIGAATGTPVFVTNWPPGLGGTGQATDALTKAVNKLPFSWTNFGKGFLKGIMSGAKWVLGPVAAVAIGVEIAKAINDQTIRPAKEFEQGAFDKYMSGLNANTDPAEIQSKIDALEASIDTSKSALDSTDFFGTALRNAAVNLSGLPFVGDALGNLRPEVEAQIAALKAYKQSLLDAAHDQEILGHAASERADAEDAASRKIKLGADKLIEHLSKTPNMGPKERAPILEQGKRLGTDPYGEQALAIFRRAANPKAPQVFGEISRHITELKDITKYYLKKGNLDAANHAMRVARKMGALIDEQVKVPAELRQARREAREDAAKAASKAVEIIARLLGIKVGTDKTSTNTAKIPQGLARVEGATAGTRNAVNRTTDAVHAVPPAVRRVEGATYGVDTTLRNKNFSPHITALVNVNVDAHVQSVVREMVIRRATTGTGSTGYQPGGGGYIEGPGYQQGAWRIPADQLAMLHEGEMVVPSKWAEPWRDALTSGSRQTDDRPIIENTNLTVAGLMRARTPYDIMKPLKTAARHRRMKHPDRYRYTKDFYEG